MQGRPTGKDATPIRMDNILHNRHYAQSQKAQRGRRKRVWHLSPDGFRELRHSCFLTPEACAKFLGVTLRTVRYWDAGRCRVPWSVVRLLRFLRLGDLGALDEAWSGWTVNRNGLWSPDGKRYHQGAMRHWWITCEQARFWREDYDRRNPVGGVGAPAPAGALLTSEPIGVGVAGQQLASLPEPAASPASPATALFVLPLAAVSVLREQLAAAAEASPSLDAGVFLGDLAMLGRAFGALPPPQLQQLQPLLGGNLIPDRHQNVHYVGDAVPQSGPSSNTGLCTEGAA